MSWCGPGEASVRGWWIETVAGGSGELGGCSFRSSVAQDSVDGGNRRGGCVGADAWNFRMRKGSC